MDPQTALATAEAVNPTAQMEPQTAQIQTETAAASNAEAAIPTPIANVDVSVQWLEPYRNSREGLHTLLQQLIRNPDSDLLPTFASSFKAVYLKLVTAEDGSETSTLVHPDEIGFLKCYNKWQDIVNNADATQADVTLAKEVVEAKMQRIFKDIYYLGQVELPSVIFCGCVDVAQMHEGKEYHGYNERTLSIREARDLKAKIQHKYEGVGQESIFLMLKQPIETQASVLSPTFQPPPPNQWTLADKRKVLNDFAGRHYNSFVDVELLMIPCCGKANICSNKKIISFLSIPREHHVPHSKNMLLWFRAAS